MESVLKLLDEFPVALAENPNNREINPKNHKKMVQASKNFAREIAFLFMLIPGVMVIMVISSVVYFNIAQVSSTIHKTFVILNIQCYYKQRTLHTTTYFGLEYFRRIIVLMISRLK